VQLLRKFVFAHVHAAENSFSFLFARAFDLSPGNGCVTGDPVSRTRWQQDQKRRIWKTLLFPKTTRDFAKLVWKRLFPDGCMGAPNSQ
jgi:hypothetical protein